MVAPVMHIVDETGIPYCEARRTVMVDPSSIENPREGDMRVILFPRTDMMSERKTR
jgi:hypothetical protein